MLLKKIYWADTVDKYPNRACLFIMLKAKKMNRITDGFTDIVVTDRDEIYFLIWVSKTSKELRKRRVSKEFGGVMNHGVTTVRTLPEPALEIFNTLVKNEPKLISPALTPITWKTYM